MISICINDSPARTKEAVIVTARSWLYIYNTHVCFSGRVSIMMENSFGGKQRQNSFYMMHEY